MENINEDECLEFHQMGLDDRILKAVAKLGWSKPTPVQQKAISLALQGRDILARARTGSGKTGAYAIAVIEKILRSKQTAREQTTKAIILAPTKELCRQACTNVMELCSSIRDIRCLDVSDFVSVEAAKPLLSENPDMIVGTPSRILEHINAGNLDLSRSVEMIVIDEADLIFSFGYEKDLQSMLKHLPDVYQAILMSATLSSDVKSLKSLVLRAPAIIKETESLPSSAQLEQFHLKCEEEDKFLLMYALIKLRLITGKMILFANTVDRCFRLKLYLDQFHIYACVLNSEMPVASRCHTVEQFNKGLYDIIIAADELSLQNPSKVKGLHKSKNKLKRKDAESGVSRGIDFRNVSAVINFDFPQDLDAYIHRVGRTARGDNKGMTLSLVCAKELGRFQEVEEAISQTHPEGIKSFDFNIEDIEGLRYRSNAVRGMVTSYAIREARLKDIKTEILNSKKLKPYLNDHQRDLQALRHDRPLHSAQIKPHLRHLPDYLIPESLQPYRVAAGSKMRRDKSAGNAKSSAGARFKKRQADPLKSFALEPAKKKRKTK